MGNPRENRNRHNRPLPNGCISGKLCFKQRSQAKTFAKKVSGQQDKTIRIYLCTICDFWHMTSTEKRRKL
jgi:hypothetical protein